MPVTVLLPRALVPYARGRTQVVLEGRPTTVREALAALGREELAAHDRVLDETGAVRPHVNVFVGEESIKFLDGLATPLAEGDTVTIVPATSGG